MLPSWDVTAARASLVAVLAAALAADAQEHGRLLGARAGGDAAASSIELLADRPLSFTTLKLAGPPRVVVDFADTDVVAEQRELEVEDGLVKRVALAPAGSRTARVVIELAEEAEFEVRAVGNNVEVRVPRPAAVAAQTPESEAEKRASLPKVELVGTPAPPEDPAAKRKREAEERAYAAKQASVDRRAAARKAEEDKRAAAALKKAQAQADRKAKAEAAAEQKRAAAEQKRAAAEQKRVAAEEKRRVAAEAAVDRRTKQLAGAERAAAARAAAKSAANGRKLALAGSAQRSITGIGFRPINGGEVIVRSDHPLEYGVSGEGDAVLLHLPSAAIPLANNRRPLDTRFFDGPVQRVVPVAVAGGTDVRIELKGHAEYQLEQSGSVLTVTFSAPSR